MEWSHRQTLMLLTGLIFLILISGCTSAPEDQSAGSPAAGHDNQLSLDKVSYGDAMAMLEDEYASGLISVNGSHICQLTGSGVDISGNATSWMIGVCNGTRNQVLACDMHGWRQMDWPGVLPDDEIDLDQILLPEEFCAKAKGPLAAAMKASDLREGDLSLSGSEYTVTLISDGTLRMLHFDALTGEEVSSA